MNQKPDDRVVFHLSRGPYTDNIRELLADLDRQRKDALLNVEAMFTEALLMLIDELSDLNAEIQPGDVAITKGGVPTAGPMPALVRAATVMLRQTTERKHEMLKKVDDTFLAIAQRSVEEFNAMNERESLRDAYGDDVANQ